MKIIGKLLQKSLRMLGYQLQRASDVYDPIIEKDLDFLEIYDECKEYTMTSKLRCYALYISTKYIIEAKIPGDIVECGVWKGGSAMVVAKTLKKMGVSDRNIYLFDTFEGMAEPTKEDYSNREQKVALNEWKANELKDHNNWCFASLDEVKSNLYNIGYPKELIHFIKGKVEEKIPSESPANISLLRLDTDWYESTKHELKHLYPIISKDGVLIIDDYGDWAGAKKAVDEYFSNNPILLNRIDVTGRIARV